MMSDLRQLPAVDQLLQTRQAAELISIYGHPLTLEAIRLVLDELREEHKQGETLPQRPAILQLIQQKLERWLEPAYVSVINATGVILHTNLGRAPLSPAAVQAMAGVSAGYCDLEYDLEKGTRGHRTERVERLLTHLTGAEAALVVNNNAAAVLLALSALARRRRVIISRTQLVEIGGGFRVPEVMRQSGAVLVEVGTTNRVHLADYEEALNQPTAAILRAYHSNFRIIGFSGEPELSELATLAHRHQVWLIDDLGSGALVDTERFGLEHEPTVQESLAAGADLVCFSGDKLLGGPQAGIIVGRKVLLDKLRKHPLARAIRVDKLCLAALAATLEHYMKDEFERTIPIWQMIAKPEKQIKARAAHWAKTLETGEVVPGKSTIGGGSLPEETLPTFLLALRVPGPNKFLAVLRAQNPPIIARVENDQVVLDPRTVSPEQEGALLVGLANALGALSTRKIAVSKTISRVR
ncbi:MAG TPA: L-seryl-tRNA(Sec) selenium transferase [Longilinea sp.]|nr:L-seryl-tRNA(Sec) selenium transferase [Longilinea sp.]